jgi:hypothetical protein
MLSKSRFRVLNNSSGSVALLAISSSRCCCRLLSIVIGSVDDCLPRDQHVSNAVKRRHIAYALPRCSLHALSRPLYIVRQPATNLPSPDATEPLSSHATHSTCKSFGMSDIQRLSTICLSRGHCRCSEAYRICYHRRGISIAL